ncbi:MAG: AMP-binding protein [Desulfobacterales bacterium]|jgi:crotonobetaine/carnitine-CoA ligase|nr:AMP-binding protein [Desulfobacterales bacterium]
MEKINITRWTRIPDYNNPAEMTTGQLDFDDEKCKRCGICSFICPARSIIADTGPGAWRNGLPRLMSIAPGISNCIACGCCLIPCPEKAISIQRPFNPGLFFQRINQTRDLRYPKQYAKNDLPPTYEVPPEPNPSEPPKTRGGQTREQKLQQLKLLKNAVAGIFKIIGEQIRYGKIFQDIKAKINKDSSDLSWAELLERRAGQAPEKKFLLYRDEAFTYRQMDENANRVANFLLRNGGGRGKGLGIFMRNSPRFLDVFFGAQKLGMYLVPINPELKGDGLAYQITHSDIEMLALDAELLSSFQTVAGQVPNLKQIFVNDIEPEAGRIDITGISNVGAKNFSPLRRAYDMPADNPGVGHNPEDICLIMYTSGTTGRPKGVVTRYKRSSVKMLMFFSYVILNEDDVYYTCLPLCHGNALFITTSLTLSAKATMALSRKFSASRFWDEIRQYNVTLFNTIGSIIPILMKQPEKETDRQNSVRVALSAACPADMWVPFEKRFGVKLFEGYGAIDSAGKGIMNLGTAPVGSLGKPANPKSIRIADEQDKDVPSGTPGELLFKIKTGDRRVEYYKNQEATEKKSEGGWLHTGDFVRQDEHGFLYFVGRKTESMRKGGENVSAYEVEHVIMDHPAVEDVAVYAVPSEMSEDEIMAAVKVVDDASLTASELREFLSDRLAKYAIPRYIRFVDEFPKTTSHRIIKGELEREGITPDTFDALSAK